MARRRPPTVHGMTVIDKPAGMTSHDVVNQLRRHFSEKRIGHAGTLDPGATGVLVVAVGNATRLMRFLSGVDKSYVGEIVLGTSTSTLDDAGETTATFDMSGVTLADAQGVVAEHLTGDIMQLGRLLGGAAHLRNLRRTRVGRFTLDQAQAPEDATLLPVETAVEHLPVVTVDGATADLIANGRVLPVWPGDGPWAVYTEGADGARGELLAVYEAFRGGQAKPVVVLSAAG
jgi:tRNA U55 pseudouridine synthase TruB